MYKANFSIRDDINMFCNPTFSRRVLGVVMLAAVIVALISGPHSALAASGYWKYSGHQITPTPEEYAAIKPLPGHVYELKATGGFQAGPGDGKGSIDNFFKTDDADLVQFLATSTLTFGAHANLATLEPGQKVMFEASLVIGGNDKSRAIPATGRGTIAIDNGEHFIDVTAKFGQTANTKGEVTIPNGGPGATMVIYIGSSLAHHGSMAPRLDINYVWVAGTPPFPPGTGGPPTSSVGISGSWSGTYKNTRGESGTETLDIKEESNGVLKGLWGGAQIVNGRRNGDAVTWEARVEARDYKVSGTISSDGKRMTLKYSVIDPLRGNYSGVEELAIR